MREIARHIGDKSSPCITLAIVDPSKPPLSVLFKTPSIARRTTGIISSTRNVQKAKDVTTVKN